MAYAIKVEPQSNVDLSAIDPNQTGGLSEEQGKQAFELLAEELGELQELLYAAQAHSLLPILQGLDTSGKDGAIRNVFKAVDPQGCRVATFKGPTPIELAHDFLWRVHQETPEKGMITVFNRSHYEDVLVVRVKELVPEETWRQRYGHINDFEQLLVESNTIVAKFYLHISEDEQRERLLAREREVEKAWKLNAGDWIERRAWAAYRSAYEDALMKCSTDHAPWHIVPANRKWFRNLAIVETLVLLLRPLVPGWLEVLEKRGRDELEAIRSARVDDHANRLTGVLPA